ncbi:MAG: formyltransferase family protein [candidate division KSB1 bacterium]|nr:formyltransferase family protein [candidate division KSB1 bacterium]MDZ7304575.1 formyltransferase family protein [candidate division KSB1 bacterium]MDZ7313630.1 formyltransferase family protein [candidate division KSB1 bacterium]
MNIVLLCKSWNHGKVLEILEALREQNVRVRGIVALAAMPKKNALCNLFRKVHERRFANLFNRFIRRFHVNEMAGGRPPGRLFHAIMPVNEGDSSLQHAPGNGNGNPDFIHQPMTIAEYARQHEIEMVMVEDLNGAESVAALQQMNTDILLLGGVPIIRDKVLAVPKVCTLNVHMGLLPQFRGMNVAEWSIFCGAPVGVSVHLVDTGVDTGAILYREQIDVADCDSIEKMRSKVSATQHRVLAKCTRLFIEGRLVPEPQKKKKRAGSITSCTKNSGRLWRRDWRAVISGWARTQSEV